MRKVLVFFMAVFVLLFLSPVFAGSGSNEGAETFLLMEESPVCLSFENYRVRDGWTPVVLSIGELDCLLWMDEAGRVSELRETGAHFVEPVCFIDVATQSLRKGANTLYFDVYEQNHVRTRWRLSPGGTPGTAGTAPKKNSFPGRWNRSLPGKPPAEIEPCDLGFPGVIPGTFPGAISRAHGESAPALGI
jgi:hypothetical protein